MSYPDIAETKPFVHIQVGILGSHGTGNASGWQLGTEGIPTPWKIQYSFSRPSWRQRSPRNCTAAPKKHLLGYWGVFRPPWCHQEVPPLSPRGSPWIFFPVLHRAPSHLRLSAEFFPNFPQSLPSWSPQPRPGFSCCPIARSRRFSSWKGGFHPRIPTGIVFWEVLTKSFFGNSWGFPMSPLGRIIGRLQQPEKNLWSKGISLPDHLQRGEPSPPSQNGAGRAKKTPDPGKDPKSRREQGREGHQEMPQPTDGMGLDAEDSGGIPARPACPAPN